MAGKTSGEDLLTLTQIHERTGISLVTLRKYKYEHAKRIPSTGEGRKQRYPERAVAVFLQIKEENMARLGRPKGSKSGGKKGSSSARARRTAPTKSRGGAAKRASKPVVEEASKDRLLTLKDVERATGISYATLNRMVNRFLDQIPKEGEGRKRRYFPEALEVFEGLRQRSRRGSRKAAQALVGAGRSAAGSAVKASAAAGKGFIKGIASLESTLKRLEKRLAAVEKELQKPIEISVKRR